MATSAPTFSAAGTPSFCAPAKLKILLVPAAPLEQAEFERWSSYVRVWEHVKLTDVPRTSRPVPSKPLYEQGEVHLSFVTSNDPAHVYLAPFQLHHNVQGVLGLTTYPAKSASDLERVPGLLRSQYPHALLHRVLAFDVHARGHTSKPERDGDMADVSAARSGHSEAETEDDDVGDMGAGADSGAGVGAAATAAGEAEFVPTAGSRGQRESGLVVFPAVRRDAKDVRFYVRTYIAEFVGTLLDHLDTLVAQLDESSLETPRETLTGAPMFKLVTERRLAPPLERRMSAASAASKMFGLKRSKSPAQPPPASLRLVKVKADVAMLNGYLWDALELYDSILTLPGKERALAGGHDAVWFAGALEGWAVTRLLVARLGADAAELAPCLLYPLTPGKDKEVHEPTPPALAWRDIAEAYSLAMAIYSKCLAPPQVQLEALRSMTNETSRDYTPPYVYACACLNYARFLLALFASGGWNSEAFDQLVYGGVPPALDTGVPLTFAEQAHLAAVSGIYRHEVAAAANAALTPSLPLLLPSDQLRVLSSLHRILSLLGYTRQVAHVSRTLGTVVCSMLARTMRVRASQGTSSSSTTSSSSVIELSWDSLGDALRWHTPPGPIPIAERIDSGVFACANPALVLGLVACDAYGIDLLTSPLLHVPTTHILEQARRRVCSHAYMDILASALGEKEAKAWLPTLSACAATAWRSRTCFGWHALQVQLLKDLIVQCEALDDHLSQVFFAALLLRDFELDEADQVALVEGLKHALPRAQWHGAPGLTLRYWGPRSLLRAIQLEPMPASLIPVTRARRDFEPRPQTDASDDGPPGLNNPFIMRTSFHQAASASKESQFVMNEVLTVHVTLVNPWAIPLPLYDVYVRTEGVPVKAANGDSVSDGLPARSDATRAAAANSPSSRPPASIHVLVPPRAVHTLRLPLVPLNTGTLQILGLHVRLWGAEPCDLFVPPSIAAIKDNLPRQVGLAARPAAVLVQHVVHTRPANEAELVKTLEPHRAEPLTCRILPQLPRIRASFPELGPSALVLQHGQETRVRVRLCNTSAVPVNFVRFEFEDSWQPSARDAILQRGLLPADVHELEWQLLHAPVISLDNDPEHPESSLAIPPHASMDARFLIRARCDCHWARIRVWYGNTDGNMPSKATLRLRSVTLTLPLSVEPSIDLSSLDVQPIERDVAERLAALMLRRSDGNERQPSSAPEAYGMTSSCALVAMDLYNHSAWPLSVCLDVQAAEHVSLRTHHTLTPGTTSRITFPFSQRHLTKEALSAPIPQLSPRQFVVSQTPHSETQVVQNKAQFWVREALLRSLDATWTNMETGVQGQVTSLRALWPMPVHVPLLVEPSVNVDVTVEECVPADSTLQVCVHVRGARSAHRVRVFLDSCLAKEKVSTHVLVADGSWDITYSAYDVQRTGGTFTWTPTLCFLSHGTWTVAAYAQVTWVASSEPFTYTSTSRCVTIV